MGMHWNIWSFLVLKNYDQWTDLLYASYENETEKRDRITSMVG